MIRNALAPVAGLLPLLAACALAACGPAGCNYDSPDLDPSLAGYFGDEDAGRTQSALDVQAAAGARADATLYALHFDGPRLNSLGENKLSLMLRDDDAADPLTVYLKVDEKSKSAPRQREAVTTFLKDKGLKDAQIEVVYGDNPASRTPAGPLLDRMHKTESGGPTPTAGAGDRGGAGSGAAGSGAAAAAGTGADMEGLTSASGTK